MEEGVGPQSDLAVVRRVLESRRDELLARPGVTGVGVGRGDRAGEFAIVCYLASERHAAALPGELEGVRVKLEVTGEFRAQRGAG